MYLKDVLGNHVSDDAEFDDLEDFDYVEEFAVDREDADMERDYDEDFDDLEDLFVDDEDLDDDDDDDDDDDVDDIVMDENDIEIHVVCEDCGHKWVDYISEEANENEFVLNCPLCGSANVVPDR